VVEADHDDADVERVVARLLELDVVCEFGAGDAIERAVLGRDLHAAVAGEGFGEAAQQAFGKGIAIDLELVGVALREWRYVAGAGRLLLADGRAERHGAQDGQSEQDTRGAGKALRIRRSLNRHGRSATPG